MPEYAVSSEYSEHRKPTMSSRAQCCQPLSVSVGFPRIALAVVVAPPGDRLDYGWRGKGSVFGTLRPASGEALTAPYARRTAANWVDLLEQADTWLPAEAE